MLKRTHYCGQPRISDSGGQVVVAGWVKACRDHGNLVFLDIRDSPVGWVKCFFFTHADVATSGLKGRYNLAQGNALGFDESQMMYRRPERAI